MVKVTRILAGSTVLTAFLVLATFFHGTEAGSRKGSNKMKPAIQRASKRYNRRMSDACVPFLPLAGIRKCTRGCSAGYSCRNRKRQCLCDGVCGRSCVIPNRPCVKPRLVNGKVEVLPYNRFGAEAIYGCSSGYVLSGPVRRVCQGDGQWSDEEPRCEREVMCTAPPIVRHSFHNGFPEDENARYSIGTQVRYTCLPGFAMFGYPKAMCLAGRWMGPRLVCSPRNCGHPGVLKNGRSEGSLFYFDHSVVFICDRGFDLIGDSFRKCMANGTWSGVQPKCLPIECPKLHPPKFGRIDSQNNTINGLVKFSCLPGYLLQGESERICQRDRRWSGRRPNCSKVQCGEIENFSNGRVVYSGSGLGAVAYFRCNPNAIPYPSGAPQRAVCLREGRWSDKPPHCLNNCKTSFAMEGSLTINGSQPSPYQYVINGQSLELSCNKSGYRLYPLKPILRCENGSYVDPTEKNSVNKSAAKMKALPFCQPLSCSKPPPGIENGLIRWRPSTHGEKAYYVCIPGYTLEGNDSVTCRYGSWRPSRKSLPKCTESFCSYPGPLKNGDIIILGRFGLYEFTPEVKKLRHGEQIEFSCRSGYRLIGARKATCVNGRWSPAFKPLCIQNTELVSNIPFESVKEIQLYRNKRQASSNCEAILNAEYRRVESVQSSSKMLEEHFSKSTKPTSMFNQNDLSKLTNSKKKSELNGSSSAQTIRIVCPPGYRTVPADGLATCMNGQWYPSVPSCFGSERAVKKRKIKVTRNGRKTALLRRIRPAIYPQSRYYTRGFLRSPN